MELVARRGPGGTDWSWNSSGASSLSQCGSMLLSVSLKRAVCSQRMN